MGSTTLSGFNGYERKTITYKETEGLQLSLDVLFPISKPSSPVPVLIHFHGGFLVVGDRYSFMPYWLVNACVARGWIFVSPDYRLIPETTAQVSVQDAADAYNWVAKSMSSHLEIHCGLIILAGSSAGGYLATVTALFADQKPAALLSIYGMLNPADNRYVTKGSNIFNHPANDMTSTLKLLESIRKQGSATVLTGYSWPRTSTSDPRNDIVSTLHIEALFPDVMTGLPGLSQQIAGHGVDVIPTEHRKLFPLSFEVPSKLAPTILFHGKNDSAVPWHLSQIAGEKLRQSGVEIYIEFPEEAEHGFDARAGRIDLEKDANDNFETAEFQSLRNVLKSLDKIVTAALAST